MKASKSKHLSINFNPLYSPPQDHYHQQRQHQHLFYQHRHHHKQHQHHHHHHHLYHTQTTTTTIIIVVSPVCFLFQVRGLHEENTQEESRYHYLHCMMGVLSQQEIRVTEEMKSYTSHDMSARKRNFR